MTDVAYLQFLRYCLNDSQPLSTSFRDIDWKKMMAWAKNQTIVGIIHQGIQRAGKKNSMPFDVLMEWIGYDHQIEMRNKILNQRCVEVVDEFRKDGYESMILKGQGNAMTYLNPYSRTSGDIDIWILTSGLSPKSEGNTDQLIRNVIRYVRQHNSETRATYHHIDYGEFKGIEVEVHYRPSYLNNFVYNRRVQKWFEDHAEIKWMELPEGVGKIPVPTWEFNVVFQLSHIYRHVIQGGIGLRQLVDYYYLLKSWNTKSQKELERTLRHLGLWKFAGAVMWVLHSQLGLEEKFLIAPMDERRGRFLFEEMMRGGNFGRYFSHKSQKLIKVDSAVGKNIARLKRDARLVRYFPSECLWEPLFRWYHFFWRVAHRF